MLRVLLTVVQVFASLAIVTLVLLQRGKGAEAGAGFGAGASGTVFGARGASNALSRTTAIFAAIFMVNSLVLTYMGTRAEAPRTILDVAGETHPATAPAQVPAPAGGTPAPAVGAGQESGAPVTAPAEGQAPQGGATLTLPPAAPAPGPATSAAPVVPPPAVPPAGAPAAPAPKPTG